jgi:hypothetical protein
LLTFLLIIIIIAYVHIILRVGVAVGACFMRGGGGGGVFLKL